MAHKWINVKNSTKGGHRPYGDYEVEVTRAIDLFEEHIGTFVDYSVRESFGTRGYASSTLKEKTYSHPLPHLTSHGTYIFGSFSVPADIDDGKSNFTNVNFLASADYLVTALNDPHTVYNPFFGDALLNLYDTHSLSGRNCTSETIIKLIAFTLSALDHSMDALSNRMLKNSIIFEKIDKRDGRKIGRELEVRMPLISQLNVEVNSLTTIVKRMMLITEKIEQSQVLFQSNEGDKCFFSTLEARYGSGLYLRAARLDAYHSNLQFECKALLDQMSESRESSLTMATHRITAYGAAILIPNMLYDFFGQSWSGMPSWFSNRGLQFSLALTVIYWSFQFWWFKRKRYL